jgi:serine phosphatase RsbU (regulator of sigma subunit)
LDTSVAHLLRELDTQPPFVLLDVLRAYLGNLLQAQGAELWLTDYAQEAMLRWTPPDEADGECMPILEGGRGTAFVEQRASSTEVPGGTCVHVPVTIRAERLGVLEVLLPDRPGTSEMRLIADAATVVAYVLLGARRYTDVFELVRRRRKLEIPAELQWELLPVLAHEGPDFTIAGSLEPAYDIGGDNFDYSVERKGLYVSITDAMGHGTGAALLCSLSVAVQRNARRRGTSLAEQVTAANEAVYGQYGGDAFLTYLGLRIDRHDGSAACVNAGHSYLYLLRDDAVSAVPLAPDLPIGLFADSQFHHQRLSFTPGDRILLLTDGIIEARPDKGEPFGAQRVTDLLLATAGDHPTEVVRKLTHAVLDHRVTALADDATAVCVDYRRTR